MAYGIDDNPYGGLPSVPRPGQAGWGAGLGVGGYVRPPRITGPKGIRTPGYTPNYDDILAKDPGLMAVRNNNAFALGQAANERDAAIGKLNYGFSGSRFGQVQQLAHDLQERLFLGNKALAARGVNTSGEQPWMQEHAQYDHDLGLYDASRALEDQIAVQVKQYLGAAQDAASSESQAITDASERAAANLLYQPKEGYAQLDDAFSRQAGHPVYKDLSGALWMLDENGNTIPFGG